MARQSRHQEYQYQYRQVAVARTIFCGYGPSLNVSIPDNMLKLINVSLHASIVFDPSVSAPSRKLWWMGGKALYNPYPDQSLKAVQPAMMPINLLADANRRVDVTIDISHLIPLLTIDSSPTFDQPSFEVDLITDPSGSFAITGVIELWKVDYIYTTKGIQ